jgi:hypothetical protein
MDMKKIKNLKSLQTVVLILFLGILACSQTQVATPTPMATATSMPTEIPTNTITPIPENENNPLNPSVQPSIISDVALGDGNTFYFNIEFSPDMQYMTFTELVGGANNIARDWMCLMDKTTGNLGGNGTGKQFLLYERTGYSVGVNRLNWQSLSLQTRIPVSSQ